MKQTAVEWLVCRIIQDKKHNDISDKVWDDIFEQAKEMEKQQIIDFGNKMQLVKDVDFDGNIEFVFKPEQYYTETFKK